MISSLAKNSIKISKTIASKWQKLDAGITGHNAQQQQQHHASTQAAPIIPGTVASSALEVKQAGGGAIANAIQHVARAFKEGTIHPTEVKGDTPPAVSPPPDPGNECCDGDGDAMFSWRQGFIMFLVAGLLLGAQAFVIKTSYNSVFPFLFTANSTVKLRKLTMARAVGLWIFFNLLFLGF